MSNLQWVIVIAIGCFLLGYCCRPTPTIETTITKVDTVIITQPIPDTIEIVREVSVPISIPSDTVVDTLVMHKIDTIFLPITIEKRQYKDSTFRAIVSGPTIHNFHPSLDTIEIYTRNTTTIVKDRPPLFSPYVSGIGGKSLVGIGGGVFIQDKHALGLEYWNVDNNAQIALRYMYKF